MKWRWNIFLVSLDPVVGSEEGKTRPALVISDESINRALSVVNILPVTGRKKGQIIYPNEVLLPAGTAGLTKDSIVLCHQIRAVDKRRLIRMLGELTDERLQEEIIAALCFQLGVLA